MKKIMVFAVFVFLLSFTAYAEETVKEQRLFDEQGYFSPQEAEALNDLLLEAENEVGFYVSVLVTDDVGSDKSEYGVRDYADVYYEEKFGKNTNGILYMINNDNKRDVISTSGSAITLFTDWRIEDTFDYVWDDMTAGRFYDGMLKFVEQVRFYYDFEQTVTSDDGDYNDSFFYIEEFEDFVKGLVIGGSVGLIVSLVILIRVLIKYKIRPRHGAAEYLDKTTVKYHQQSDTFIRKYVTSRVIESSSDGGGGSSTHTSSGGGTHGGGSRSR